ncbi:head GIN domain-containing protein [soil metagenome]
MKGLIPATLALSAMLTAAPALAATQPYTITSFDSIRVNAPVRVVIATGAGVSARGEGSRDALDRVDLTVSGTVLTVRMKAPQAGEKAAGPVTLTLSTGQLGRVLLSGGGSVAVDRMKGLRGDLVLAGGGDIAVGAVALDRLDVVVTGSGRVTLAGMAGVFNADVSGPGALAAEGLKTKQAKLVSTGPGSIVLTAATSADINARGSGDVTVTGKAACKVYRGGTGRIVCGGEDY